MSSATVAAAASAAAAAAASSGVAASARSSRPADDSDAEFERLVLDQLAAAVRQLEASWDESRRRDFVVQVLMSSLGDERPDGNNSWPSVDRFSLRGIKIICRQLALDVVEGPRARAHMVEDIQCALWDLWERTRRPMEPQEPAHSEAEKSKQREGAGVVPMDSQSDGEEQPPHSAAVASSSSPVKGRSSPRAKPRPVPLPVFHPPARPKPARRSEHDDVPSQRDLPASVLAALAALPSSQPSVPRGRGGADAGRRSPPKVRSAPPARLPLPWSDGDPDDCGGDSGDDSSDGDFDPSDPFGVLGKARQADRGRVRRGDLDDEMESSGHTSYMAKQYITNVLRSSGGTSVHRTFKEDVKFKSERNRRECLALARIIDAALRNDLKQLLELAVRRLAGVHTADTSDNNWDACDAIEQVMERQSFVPTKFLQRALKTVVQLQALQKQSDHGSGQKNKKNQKGGRGGASAAPEGSSGPPGGAAAQSAKKATGGGSAKP